MARILAVTPTFDGRMCPESFKSIWDLDKCGHDVLFGFVRGYTVADARHAMVERAREVGADYLLMVDSDVVVPQDALANLLECDAHVCLGYYAHRGSMGRLTNLCAVGGHFHSLYSAADMHAKRDAGDPLLIVKGGGLGCALVKMEVFDLISYPFFRWYVYPDGHGTLSEDLYFALKCEKAGIPIVADARVECGHVLSGTVYPGEWGFR